jgi:methionyl-tRNA formyltransferase
MRKVLLVGMGPTAPSALASLVDACAVVGVVRAVDAADRQSDPVVLLASRHRVPIFDVTSVTGLRVLVDQLRPDCVVVSSFDRILPADLIASCPFLNVHYAPLPQFRGRANVNWAIITGQSETAISIHVLAPGLDAGNILFQQAIPIDSNDTIGGLYDRLNQLQREHLGETVVRFLNGDGGTPQREDAATYGCTRLPSDGEIDWSRPTAEVHALIRALMPPYPGAFTYADGRRLVIWRASVVEQPRRFVGRVPGRVVDVSREHGYVDVLTGDGILRLVEVEAAAGRREPAASVLRSVRTTLGLRTSDLLSRIDALEREIDRLRRQLMSSADAPVRV